MKIKKALLASILFLASLSGTYIIHIKYFQVDVVFYSAMFDGVLASMFASTIFFSIKYFNDFNIFEKTQMTIIWLLTGYAIAISVPTVLDRSLSFYILEKLDQRGGGIQLAHFEEVFTEEYVREHRLVDVRLTEQQASGTIIIQDGCVKLTERGKRLAGFSRYFRNNLLSKRRLLMGEYTDDLIDPFKRSVPNKNYGCQ